MGAAFRLSVIVVKLWFGGTMEYGVNLNVDPGTVAHVGLFLGIYISVVFKVDWSYCTDAELPIFLLNCSLLSFKCRFRAFALGLIRKL